MMFTPASPFPCVPLFIAICQIKISFSEALVLEKSSSAINATTPGNPSTRPWCEFGAAAPCHVLACHF